MSDQLVQVQEDAQAQEDLSEFYERMKREWEARQIDAVLSFNEFAALVDCLKDGVFTGDYQQLAELEVSDA